MSEAPRGPGASGPDTGAAVALALARRGDRAPNGGQAPRRFLRVSQDGRSPVPNFIPRVRQDTEQVQVNHAPQTSDTAPRPAADALPTGQSVDQVILYQALLGMFQGNGPQGGERVFAGAPFRTVRDKADEEQIIKDARVGFLVDRHGRRRDGGEAAPREEGATTSRRQPAGERVYAGASFLPDGRSEDQIWRDATEGFLVDSKGRRIPEPAQEASHIPDAKRAPDGEARQAPGAGTREAKAASATDTSLKEDAPGNRKGRTGKEYPELSHPGDLRKGHSDTLLTAESSYRVETPSYSFKNFTSDLINLRILNLLALKPPDNPQKALPPGFKPGVGCTDAVTPEDYMPITIFNLLFRFKEVVHSYKKYGNVNMPTPPGP